MQMTRKKEPKKLNRKNGQIRHSGKPKNSNGRRMKKIELAN